MKPLVCVAPDGSLEVWVWVDHRGWVLNNEKWAIFNVCYDRDYDPKFWGREVLGEL